MKIDQAKIVDDGKPFKYYCLLPNMVDDAGLSLIAFRLYVHLKRVTGEQGDCWQSTQTLSRHCNMAKSSIQKAKQELVKAGLIKVRTVPGEHGEFGYTEINITDIWEENIKKYTAVPPDGTDRTATKYRSVPPDGNKEQPLKNNNTSEVEIFFQEEFNKPVSRTMREQIELAEEEHGPAKVIAALQEASINGATSPWNYAKKILVRKKQEAQPERVYGEVYFA